MNWALFSYKEYLNRRLFSKLTLVLRLFKHYELYSNLSNYLFFHLELESFNLYDQLDDSCFSYLIRHRGLTYHTTHMSMGPFWTHMDHTYSLVNSCYNFMGSILTNNFDDHMLFDSRLLWINRLFRHFGPLNGDRSESLVVWS